MFFENKEEIKIEDSDTVPACFCGLIASLASAQSSFSHYNFTAGAGLGIGRGDVAQFVGGLV